MESSTTTLAVADVAAVTTRFEDLPVNIRQLIVKHKLENDWQYVFEQFADALTSIGDWKQQNEAIDVTGREDLDAMARAGDLWKAVQSVYTTIEDRRKSIKDPFLRQCQLIDGIAGIIKLEIEPLRESLRSKRDFARDLELRERRELGEQRLIILTHYGSGTGLSAAQLGTMSADEFESLRQSTEAAHLARLDQIARERLEREQQAEQLRIERERREIAERAALAERAERERLERIEADRIASEQAAALEKVREAERLAQAPDREKLLALADRIEAVTRTNPDVATPAAAWALTNATERLLAVVRDLRAFGTETEAQQ